MNEVDQQPTLSTSNDQSGWLLEWRGHSGVYFSPGWRKGDKWEWITTNHDEAVRFAREEDANRTKSMFRMVNSTFFQGPEWVATEHVWMDRYAHETSESYTREDVEAIGAMIVAGRSVASALRDGPSTCEQEGHDWVTHCADCGKRGESTQTYWLCCGETDYNEHPQSCVEAKSGHPERCRYGTAAEHSAWQLSQKAEAKVLPPCTCDDSVGECHGAAEAARYGRSCRQFSQNGLGDEVKP